jgi:hypothetical protein
MICGVGLSREAVLKVREAVVNDFPQMGDVDPLVEKMNVRMEETEIVRYRVSFRKTVLLEEGVPSTQSVRVTTDGEGNILKMLSSRG